jgi:hypothetical protein
MLFAFFVFSDMFFSTFPKKERSTTTAEPQACGSAVVLVDPLSARFAALGKFVRSAATTLAE